MEVSITFTGIESASSLYTISGKRIRGTTCSPFRLFRGIGLRIYLELRTGGIPVFKDQGYCACLLPGGHSFGSTLENSLGFKGEDFKRKGHGYSPAIGTGLFGRSFNRYF
jgi:hypothetical protein